MKRQYTLGKRVVAGALAAAAPLWWLVRPRRPAVPDDAIRSILVVELWRLGDLVLCTAALRALRARHPAARIALLAPPVAVELLEGTGLVDDVIPFVFPWTAERGKYRPARYDLRALRRVVRVLRGRRFDAAIAARMDPRDHMLLALSGAPRRVGIAHGGGEYFLSEPVPASDGHRVEDWGNVARALGFRGPTPPIELAILPGERAEARRWLASHGIGAGDQVVGLHVGASSPLRQWSLGKFAEIGRRAAGAGERVVVFQDPRGGDDPVSVPGAVTARVPLRTMMALLAECRLVVCNDSGPMHIAAALGVPTVSIFTAQRPDWYAPLGDAHGVAMREGFACRPCFDRCVFAEPYCNTSVGVDDVWPLVAARLAPGEAAGRPARA